MSEPGPNYSGSGLPPCATNSKRDCIGHRAALARSAVEVRGLGSRVCALPPRPLPDVRILSNHESDSRGAVPSTDDPASAVGSVRRRRASLPPHIESLQAAGRRCWRPRREAEVSISPELTSRSPVDAACHDAVVTFQSALTLHGEVNVPIRNLSRPMRVGRPTRRARAPRPLASRERFHAADPTQAASRWGGVARWRFIRRSIPDCGCIAVAAGRWRSSGVAPRGGLDVFHACRGGDCRGCGGPFHPARRDNGRGQGCGLRRVRGSARCGALWLATGTLCKPAVPEGSK